MIILMISLQGMAECNAFLNFLFFCCNDVWLRYIIFKVMFYNKSSGIIRMNISKMFKAKARPFLIK